MKRKIIIAVITCLVLFFLATLKVYGLFSGPDTQCSISHTTTAKLPNQLNTAWDFFRAGDYYYDIGKCQEAVSYYTTAIARNPFTARFYNNRGYTQMRLRNYEEALVDFTKAISLDPKYPQPYLNRGDLYNFWGPELNTQKAIADYQKAISLGAVHNTSVCGHLAMAQTNNLIPLAILTFVFNRGYCK